MPILKSRLGDWDLEYVHAWSERQLTIRATSEPIIGPDTKVATIGSCFASELAAVMGELGIRGGMHPGGLYYSTATIRQELERIAGGWSQRALDPPWETPNGLVDPFRSYDAYHATETALQQSRAAADAKADALFRDAKVVVVTLGLIETWRNPSSGNTYRQIPHPAAFPSLNLEFHRLTVAEMLEDLERIRTVVRDHIGAQLIITTSPVPLHTTFTPLDVRVANTESKSRIRAATSEFTEAHSDVRYFHSYEMVVTAERQSDFFREDGRHVHRHAVRYIVSEFLRLFGEPSLHQSDMDTAFLTPIEKTAATVEPEPGPRPTAAAGSSATNGTGGTARPGRPPVSFPRRVIRGVRRRARSTLGIG